MGVKDKRRPFANLKLPHSILHRECVIWSYVSFAGAASVHESSHADQILGLIFSVVPECQDWGYLEAMVHRFFWTQNIKLSWKHCWECVQSP